MNSGFNDYVWNGAVWNGSSSFVLTQNAHAICIEAEAKWNTGTEAVTLIAEAKWEIEITATIPEC